jgi:hypothetical protein
MATRGRVLLSVLPLLLLSYPAANAASLSGRSSTQAYFFADEAGRDHLDLVQYLRFHGSGFGADNTLSVSGYGRAWGDAGQGGGVEGRLYYLYLDKREMPGRTDVRVGRQFFFVGAGAAVVDGARLDTRFAGPLALTAVGGRRVVFDATGEDTGRGDVAAAARASLTGIPGTSVDLSYYVSYDENDLARETVGLQASRRLGPSSEVYAQARLDLLSEVFSEITAGARTALIPGLTLVAESFRAIPQFDATSIYAVFAVERFQEVTVRAQYDVDSNLSLSGEFRNESYGGGDEANAGEMGLRYRPRDGSRYSLYAAGIYRNGTGGSLAGFELSGDVAFDKRHVLAAGVQHDDFRRETMESFDSATRVWAGVESRLLKNLSVSARVEDTVSAGYGKDLRARLALNVDF